MKFVPEPPSVVGGRPTPRNNDPTPSLCTNRGGSTVQRRHTTLNRFSSAFRELGEGREEGRGGGGECLCIPCQVARGRVCDGFDPTSSGFLDEAFSRIVGCVVLSL